ncbi:MAG: hypothetical protein NZM43_02420 [Saprospiraceae bacterium]|nr:hypothetical protein [Saprospiraceae bacterium]MDW8483156.1 hypothetical protein [Saprospiraceae bacterium]
MEKAFNNSGSFYHSTEPMHRDWATTASWASFIAIVTYVFLGLSAFTLILVYTAVGPLLDAYNDTDSPFPYSVLAGGSVLSVAVALVFLGLLTVINTFLFRFARRLKMALGSQDQDAFETAWLNFRNYFRWNGIIILVVIFTYIVTIVAVAVALGRLSEF